MAKKRSTDVSTAIIYILVGIIFCIFKSTLLDWLMTLVGALFIVQGIAKALRGALFGGAVSAVIGIVILVGGFMFLELVLLVFGALLLVSGIIDLISELKRKKPRLINVFIKLIIGVMLLVSRYAMLDWIFILIGALFIVDGILYFVNKK